MSKKKVSFDIDNRLLSDIKSLCTAEDIKLSEFLRGAAEDGFEKLKEASEKRLLFIISTEHGIVKRSVDMSNMFSVEYSASQEMQENVNAKEEGFFLLSDVKDKKERLELSTYSDHSGRVVFFTKSNLNQHK